MNNLVAPFRLIRQHGHLLKSAVQSEIKQRYAGSAIGVFWGALYPLILFFIYSALYLVIFRVRPLDMTSYQYVIYIMSGLIPFLGFSEALSAGTTSIANNKSLLLNTVYPSEFIPLQAVIANSTSIAVGVVLLTIAHLLLLGLPGWTLLLLPVLIVMQLMFTIGIVWVLSILNLLVKDIQQSLSFVTMILMIISPIAYTPSMVPRALKLMIWMNPFSYYVRCYQDLVLRQQIGSSFVVAALLSLLLFSVGYGFYNKTKKVFYEYV